MRVIIDLRSDTKTLPCAEMLHAGLQAQVGDDVAGEDPTVNALQERCAELFGKEAGLFVTGGTLGNLVSIYSLVRPGEELICHELAHIYHYERSGVSAVCGAMVRPLPGLHGILDLSRLSDTLVEGDLHRQKTGVVCMENTHNNCGGTVLNAEQMDAVGKIAHEHGIPLHVDGARILDAAVALDLEPQKLVASADSCTFCFSKSLGCPVGAMVVGTSEFIENARKARKMFGGGMRQAGVLAGMANWALDHNVCRLADDQRHAREIAETLSTLCGIEVDLGSVQSNMVYFRVVRDDMNAPQLCERLGEHGIVAAARDEKLIRFVTHLNISDADAATVCEVLRDIIG